MVTSNFNKSQLQFSKFILMLIVVVSLPLATILVQKNQENRSNAATGVCKVGERKCVQVNCVKEPCYPVAHSCSNGSWTKGETCTYGCKNGVCNKKPTPTPTKTAECKNGDRRCIDNGIRCLDALDGTTHVKSPCPSLDTQVCSNGVWKKDGNCTSSCSSKGVCNVTLTPTITSDSPKLNSKISFYGVKPNVSCIARLKSVSVEIDIISDNKKNQLLTNVPISPIANEVNSNGDQVFQINNLALNSSIFKKSDTFLYIKIKGPSHLKQKFCINNQNKSINNNDGCNINLYSKNIYNFSNYSLLPGDVNQDEVTNGIDFSLIKNQMNIYDSLNCETSSDLNFDGFVNSVDLNLIKMTLSSKKDE